MAQNGPLITSPRPSSGEFNEPQHGRDSLEATIDPRTSIPIPDAVCIRLPSVEAVKTLDAKALRVACEKPLQDLMINMNDGDDLEGHALGRRVEEFLKEGYEHFLYGQHLPDDAEDDELTLDLLRRILILRLLQELQKNANKD